MRFEDAKQFLISYDMYEQAADLGIGAAELAQKYHMNIRTVENRIYGVAKLSAQGTLVERVATARKVLEETFKKIEAINAKSCEPLPVRSSSGCRFSPLY